MQRSPASGWRALSLLLAGLLSAPAHAEPVEGTGAEAPSLAEETFLDGQQLFLEGNHEAALPLFEESYSLKPSPNSRLYVARCLAELGELLRAYEVYREVIVAVSDVENPNRYAATQMAASEERAALREKLARVRITLNRVPAGLRLRLSERALTQRGLSGEHFAEPGVVTLEASAPGYLPSSQALEAVGGQTIDVMIVMAEAVEPVVLPPPPPVVRRVEVHSSGDDWAWVSAGVGVAGLATWGVFGIQAERRYHRIAADCEAGHCPAAQVERGKRDTLISNIGLGVGALGLVGAGTLWILSREDEPRPPAGYDAARSRKKRPREPSSADLAIVLHPTGVSAVGSF